jgi:hypothetical protein
VIRVGDDRGPARGLREEPGTNEDDDIAVDVFFRAASPMKQRTVHVTDRERGRPKEHSGPLPTAVEHGGWCGRH